MSLIMDGELIRVNVAASRSRNELSSAAENMLRELLNTLHEKYKFPSSVAFPIPCVNYQDRVTGIAWDAARDFGKYVKEMKK